MSQQEWQIELKRLLIRYRTIRLTETVLLSATVGLVTYALADLFSASMLLSLFIACTAAVLAFVLRTRQLRVFQIDLQSVIRYLNRQFPQLQESGGLLLRDTQELTQLEQLQQLKTGRSFSEILKSVRLPHQLLSVFMLTICGTLIAAVIIVAFHEPGTIRKTQGSTSTGPIKSEVALPASVNSLDLRLTPPAYTQSGVQTIHTFPISTPEGSDAHWNISFSGSVQKAALIFDGHDTLAMQHSGDAYSAHRKITSSGFYQLNWYDAMGETKYSDFYSIEARKDAAPQLKITNQNQFVQLDAAPVLQVNMKSTLTDDYGLKDAYIVATVSKGSGEGIKFREERLRFDSPSQIGGKQIQASRRIDLIKLGLEPGDELYYYVEAFDNKTPAANRARTETYFIAVKDTAEVATSVDPGLGVDLMPEYFRSQRQIIIDSEKLLKEKRHLTKEQFNTRSNNLAHDEKVLRLRYGEFLGEEFETSIGPVAGGDAPANDADVMKQYGHQHDTDEEHAARVETPAKTPAHGHDHAKNDKDEDPAKAYMHAHDSEEEATFFTQSIRSKLKAAITIMWDAELHLRLYAPEKSLPYQYRALKLLKEISQDSRIYVHRTGFDPPPLKEDKRLSGELTEAKSSVGNPQSPNVETYPSTRRALAWLESREAAKDSVDAPARTLLLQAGNELSAAAMRQPGRYLKALSVLRPFAQNELPRVERGEAVKTLRAAFYQVLPANAYRPSARTKATHPLDDVFLKNYDALPNDLSQ